MKTENKTKERIWELDFLRGFAFLLMVFDHFFYDVGFIFFIPFIRQEDFGESLPLLQSAIKTTA